jgi:hypothetical protein
MLSLLALALFFGGLIITQIHPIPGVLVVLAGLGCAGKALNRPGDMDTLFGLMLLCGIASAVLAFF